MSVIINTVTTPKVSVCTIFRNEEGFLPDFLDCLSCLDEVSHGSFELILVDTGSTDRSLKILENRGLSPLYFEWVQDFSAARNFSLQKATGDWILVLDVDDRIPRATLKKLLDLLPETHADAFYLSYISVNSFDWQRSDVPVKDVQARLMVFRNHLGFHYQNPVHETIDSVIQEKAGCIENLDLPVYHLGYVDKLCPLKDQRNEEIIRVNFNKDPQNPDFIFNYTTLIWSSEPQVYMLLSQAFTRAKTALAYAIAERALAWIDEFGPPPMDSDRSAIDWEKALLKINPQAAFVFLRRARRHFTNAKIGEARSAYETVKKRLSFEALRPEVWKEVLDRLGVLYAMEGRLKEAMECVRILEAREGRNEGSYHQILKLLFAAKDYPGFISEIKNFPRKLSSLDEPKRKALLSFLDALDFRGKKEVREKFMKKAAL